MKVILLEDIERLGKSGEVCGVADGYARNYLIPQKKALIASSSNLRIFEEKKRMDIVREEKKRRSFENLAKKLNEISCTAVVQAGEDERLFGTVTTQDIADLLATEGFQIDKRKIILEQPIKTLGVYSIVVKLYKDIEAKVKLWVVRQ
ncbi:MAG: 50S ribosomal protein L9 [Candidatus Edwardsbacteria bacterium]